MTETPSSKTKLNPFLLAVVAILVVAAVGFGLSRMGGSSERDGGAGGSGGGSSKSSSRSAWSGLFGSRHKGKSTDKTEEERIAGKPGVPFDREEVKEMLVRVSVEARDELKDLRARSKTEFDDPEERRAFGERLSQVKDPNERREMLRERTAAMQEARAQAEALKSSADIQREKRLIVLMQVQNLWRMAQFVSKNPQLKSEAEAFNEQLVSWVKGSESMDEKRFHAEFSQLRGVLTDLRKRNGNIGRPPASAVKPPVQYSPSDTNQQ